MWPFPLTQSPSVSVRWSFFLSLTQPLSFSVNWSLFLTQPPRHRVKWFFSWHNHLTETWLTLIRDWSKWLGLFCLPVQGPVIHSRQITLRLFLGGVVLLPHVFTTSISLDLSLLCYVPISLSILTGNLRPVRSFHDTTHSLYGRSTLCPIAWPKLSGSSNHYWLALPNPLLSNPDFFQFLVG